MRELALNILDLSQNSITAGADFINITVSQNAQTDRLYMELKDNGCGMTKEQCENVVDPFYTTRTTRKVGLGVPFFKMAAEMTGGSFSIKSEKGVGTIVSAEFVLSSVDLIPVGDMEGVVKDLIYMNPSIDFVYKRAINNKSFVVDTRELKEILGGVPLNDPEVCLWLGEYLKEQLESIIN
ncbi:MAG: ATP-binding protein [Oscillospiraceae bacterium]